MLKRHRPDPFLLTHALDGWSLAMDFPAARSQPDGAVGPDCSDMTGRVLEAGGKFYFAKDSVLDAAEFARAYGDRLERFAAVKRKLDPHGLLMGDQARRLMPGLAGA